MHAQTGRETASAPSVHTLGNVRALPALLHLLPGADIRNAPVLSHHQAPVGDDVHLAPTTAGEEEQEQEHTA